MRKINLFLISILLIGSVFSGAKLDAPAAPFSLSNTKNELKKLTDFKGKVLFLNFWASWCPPCKQEFPELNQLAQDYKDKGVEVCAVNIDKEKANLDKFLQKNLKGTLNLTVLMDPKGSAATAYGVRSMPTSYIIDQKGNIRFIHSGFNSKDVKIWRDEIEALLQEK